MSHATVAKHDMLDNMLSFINIYIYICIYLYIYIYTVKILNDHIHIK